LKVVTHQKDQRVVNRKKKVEGVAARVIKKGIVDAKVFQVGKKKLLVVESTL
jgi:hypothetical protein